MSGDARARRSQLEAGRVVNVYPRSVVTWRSRRACQSPEAWVEMALRVYQTYKFKMRSSRVDSRINFKILVSKGDEKVLENMLPRCLIANL